MSACRTGKQRYRDRIAALLALAQAGRKSSGNRNEQRAYRCNLCNGWHLTSQPYRPRAKRS